VIKTIIWALKNDLKEITICHDYVGVEHFVTGRWIPKTDITIVIEKDVIRSWLRE